MAAFDPKTYPALTNTNGSITNDGTRAWFDFTTSDGKVLRFSVNPEALGTLVRGLKSAAHSVAEKLNASGQAGKYQSGGFEQAPDRVLSMAIGTEGVEGSSPEFMLVIQTEDGAFSRLVVPTDVALKIADEIGRLKPQLDKSSKSPAKH
jgi:hypothetical protein